MRLNIIKILALYIMLSGMAGIAAADPCPGPNSNEWSDTNLLDSSLIVLYENIGLNTLKIYAQHANENPSGGIPGFKEVCFYALPGMIGVSPLWTTGGKNWGAGITGDGVAEFVGSRGSPGASGDPYNIPFDGKLNEVGTITFSGTPDLGSAKSLVHVVSYEKCGGTLANPNSCWKRPQPPLAPVPELSPIILTSAGLLGILLVSRKYRSN